MDALDSSPTPVQAAAESVALEMAHVRHWDDCSLINLPLIYPGGSNVTVKLTFGEDGFRVSDNGFAFRDAEAYGLDVEAFSGILDKVIGETDLCKTHRTIYVNTPYDTLYSAICEVAAASLKAAENASLHGSRWQENLIEESSNRAPPTAT